MFAFEQPAMPAESNQRTSLISHQLGQVDSIQQSEASGSTSTPPLTGVQRGAYTLALRYINCNVSRDASLCREDYIDLTTLTNQLNRVSPHLKSYYPEERCALLERLQEFCTTAAPAEFESKRVAINDIASQWERVNGPYASVDTTLTLAAMLAFQLTMAGFYWPEWDLTQLRLNDNAPSIEQLIDRPSLCCPWLIFWSPTNPAQLARRLAFSNELQLNMQRYLRRHHQALGSTNSLTEVDDLLHRIKLQLIACHPQVLRQHANAVGLLVAHLSAYDTLAQRGPERLTEVNNCTFELGKQLLTTFEQQLQNDASNHRIGT